MNFKFRNAILTATIFIVAVLFWHQWVPAKLSFEAPGWDESDRARDALALFLQLRLFKIWALFYQSLFFETWGPLFALFAQVPLVLFGANAHSLTFVSFFALFFACGFSLLFVQRKYGWPTAIATVTFIFIWIAGVQGFASYWVLLMIESWVIVGWLTLALAGALVDVDLLIIGSWLLFLTKYQYYPVIFAGVVLFFGWGNRTSLRPFLKEFFSPAWVRVVAMVVALFVVHIFVMKCFGPIYGQTGWDKPRALRNPVLYAFILVAALAFARRKVMSAFLVNSVWEVRFIKYFFWPATVLMAFPWPNRWAGVVVTQDAQPISHSALELTSLYFHDIVSALTWPMLTLTVLLVLSVAAFGMSVSKTLKAGTEKKTISQLVILLFGAQLFTLLFAVKNYQARFVFAIFLTAPAGLWLYLLGGLNTKWRSAIAVASIAAAVSLLTFTNYFQPSVFFYIPAAEGVDQAFVQNPSLFPLETSLDPLVTDFAVANRKTSLALGVLSDHGPWWDRPMQLWPVEYQIRNGVHVDAKAFVSSTEACAAVRSNEIDLLLKPAVSTWEKVLCP